MTMLEFAELATWLFAGLALGGIYIWLIGRSVMALTTLAGKRAVAGYFIVRTVLAAVSFWVAANQGALPLLMMLLGFLTARTLTIRKIRKAESGR